jgi:hypothetical protein
MNTNCERALVGSARVSDNAEIVIGLGKLGRGVAALRLRVPRQLGYKSVKFVTRLMVTDSLKGFVSALDPKSPNFGYSWYAGI